MFALWWKMGKMLCAPSIQLQKQILRITLAAEKINEYFEKESQIRESYKAPVTTAAAGTTPPPAAGKH